MTATVNPLEIAVSHSIRPDVNREFLAISCPRGWEDVEKIKNRVLTLDGKQFTYTGWNSDRNEAFFARPLHTYSLQIATIGR